MRTVSFQGSQLSASDRRRLALQQHVRSFMTPALQQQVHQTLAAVDRLRESPQDDPYRFRLDYQSKGTPWLGDVFGL